MASEATRTKQVAKEQGSELDHLIHEHLDKVLPVVYEMADRLDIPKERRGPIEDTGKLILPHLSDIATVVYSYLAESLKRQDVDTLKRAFEDIVDNKEEIQRAVERFLNCSPESELNTVASVLKTVNANTSQYLEAFPELPQQVAALYTELSGRLSEMALLLLLTTVYTEAIRSKPRRLPRISNPWQGRYGVIPSSPPLIGLLRSTEDAAEGAHNWTDYENTTVPTYRHLVGDNGRKGAVDISLRSYEGDAIVVDTMLSTLWDQVNELDDLTGDVLLAALAQSLRTSGNGRTWITADAILNYRGIKPKTKREGDSRYRAGHHLEHRMAVARAFEQLDHLWLNLIDVEVVETNGKTRKPQKLRLESKVIAISDRISQSGLGGDYIPIAWHYQPGEWAKPFLSPGFRETALLAQKSLQYDPYHQIWEKRLARYFALHWRIRAPHGNYEQPYRVGNLLETISIKPNERFPLRTRERLEKALDRLQDDGVIARWEYQRWEEELPTKGWLATWLEWTFLVTPPEEVIHYYTSIAKNYKRRRSLPKETSVATTPSLS